MATTSLGSSTTQMACTSRRGSRQIRQRVASATLKHSSQNRTRALTSVRESTSRSTSAGSACSRWNAIRCALLGPTPGSLPSSSMRSWTAPSYTRRDYDLTSTLSCAAAPGCRWAVSRRSVAHEHVLAGLVEGANHLVVAELALGDDGDGGRTAADHLDPGVEHAVEGHQLLADRAGAVPAGQPGGLEPQGRRHGAVLLRCRPPRRSTRAAARCTCRPAPGRTGRRWRP